MRSFPRASLAVWILAAVFWSQFLAFVGLRLLTPSDGARLPPGRPQLAAAGLSLEPLRPGSLEAGDVVVAVNGQTTESLAVGLSRFDEAGPTWTFGQSLTYTVERAGFRRDIPVILGPYPIGALLAENWGALVMAAVFQLVTAVLFVKRPAEPVARVMFLAAASLVSATTWSFGLQVSDLLHKTGFWLYTASTVGAYMLLWVGALHGTLLFPSPWPPLVRFRWVGGVLYVVPFAVLASVTLAAPSPNPLAWQQRLGQTISYLQAVYVGLAMLAAVRSFRAARDPVSRSQVRWVITAFVVAFVSAMAFGIIPELVLGYPLLSWDGLALIGLLIPVALGVAVLRYRLFDIDLILNRTLVYGALTFLVAAVYIVIVGGLGAWLQAGNDLVISLFATGLVAIVIQPARARLQLAINRLMYGDRDDPYAVLSRLGQQMESTLAPDTVLPTIVETVAQTLQLPYAAISLREGGADRVAASYGLPRVTVSGLTPIGPHTPASSGKAEPAPEQFTFPLHFQGELIGHLVVYPRAPDEPFTPGERRLLHDMARQIEVAVNNVRLTADLQRSRERLIAAREEERRRIRRDLHDGLGPTLASHSYRLDAVLDLIDQDPAAARQLVADLKSQTQATLADIRRLVYELRPPALDELGLVAALQAQFADSANGLRITIETPAQPLPPLSAAAEVAAYRIAMEAVNNAARHAHGRQCRVNFSAGDSELTLEIADDGQGIAHGARAGVGLASMRERAAELGGSLTIEPAPAGGTRIVARLPLAIAAGEP